MIDGILARVTQTHTLLKEEIIRLLLLPDATALFAAADKIRRDFVGDGVYLRALIEFSNYCKNNCLYCGIRAGNTHVKRYRLTPEQMIQTAKQAAGYGYKTIVLQSGEDEYFSSDKMCKIIKEIKDMDTAVTLSLGEKTYDEYKTYRDSGADRYLIRIETTDIDLYKNMHPNMDYNNRIRCLEDLKILGYEVGTGCLVGLPNQTIESLANDILFFKSINADMVGIGPYISNPNTPLKDEPNGDFYLALKVMAITRIMLPDINIPATTAMETLNQNGRIIALQSGANVVMPNVTYSKYRNKYEIYPNKICVSERPEDCRKCIEGKIKSIGRTISAGYGYRGDK